MVVTIAMIALLSRSCVKVVKPKSEDAPLAIRVESAADGDTDEIGRRVVAAVKEGLGIDASVSVLARDTLPRSGYKATRLVDE